MGCPRRELKVTEKPRQAQIALSRLRCIEYEPLSQDGDRAALNARLIFSARDDLDD